MSLTEVARQTAQRVIVQEMVKALRGNLYETEYLRFQLLADTGKTQIWQVVSRRDGNILGHLRWFGRWRQYTFMPAVETVFNVGCLSDIQRVLTALMELRRED